MTFAPEAGANGEKARLGRMCGGQASAWVLLSVHQRSQTDYVRSWRSRSLDRMDGCSEESPRQAKGATAERIRAGRSRRLTARSGGGRRHGHRHARLPRPAQAGLPRLGRDQRPGGHRDLPAGAQADRPGAAGLPHARDGREEHVPGIEEDQPGVRALVGSSYDERKEPLPSWTPERRGSSRNPVAWRRSPGPSAPQSRDETRPRAGKGAAAEAADLNNGRAFPRCGRTAIARQPVLLPLCAPLPPPTQ